MKRVIQGAVDSGIPAENIFCVCGAYHVAGLETCAPMTDEEEKNLPLADCTATLMPYSYYRLSSRSGYGAGNRAPAYFELLWDALNGERIYYQNGVQVAYSNQAMSGSVTLTGDCYVGKSWNDERYIPGEISELRVWSVARTADEIANNIYGVNPESEGLVAYWKFNEGVGSSITDHANGTNLSAVGGTPTWVPVTLPEIK